jgi:hypothetical protein
MIFTPILAPAHKFAGAAKQPRIKPARQADGKMALSYGTIAGMPPSYCFCSCKHVSAA